MEVEDGFRGLEARNIYAPGSASVRRNTAIVPHTWICTAIPYSAAREGVYESSATGQSAADLMLE